MKTLNIVIPVYNEEKRLYKTVDSLMEGFSFDGIKLANVIFVDDGSTDRTVAKLRANRIILEKKLDANVFVITQPKNRGKGYAIRTGMIASNADYTLCFDADISTPITEFKKFLPLIKKNTDIIFGTRKNGQSTVIRHQPFYREMLGRCYTLLSNLVLNTWVTDFTCGFKVFSRKAKDDIFSLATIDGWGYDAESAFLAKKYGYQIKEVPVRWSNDDRTKVRLFSALPQSFVELLTIRLRDAKGVYNKYMPAVFLFQRARES